MMMKKPPPIEVIDLFPEVLDHLLALLSGLSEADWDTPTTCQGWSVKDVAQHLLGIDFGILSRQRDGYRLPGQRIETWDELVALINTLNEQWVQVSRRMSGRLLCDLLRFTGTQVVDYYQTLALYALGGPVSWAGPDPAPVWLDLAREYTERWHHQQHIRDAVNKPGLKDAHYLRPVLEAFARALPYTYHDLDAPQGTVVALTIEGPAGSAWSLHREVGTWALYQDVFPNPAVEVQIGQDLAWRLFTKGCSPDEARGQVSINGDEALGLRVLGMVAIIA